MGRAVFEKKALLLGVSIAGIFAFGYLWRIGSLLPGANADELGTITAARSLKDIAHNLINAPYHLLQYLLEKLPIAHLTAGRLSSAIWLALFAGCFYFIAKSWFGRPTAAFGILLLITNPYALIIGRTATPRVMLFWPVVVTAAISWALQTERRINLAWLVFCLSLGLSLYTPGMFWILLVALVFVRGELKKIVSVIPKKVTYSGLVLGLLLLIPLGYSLIKGQTSLRELLWLPASWHNWPTMLEYLGWGLSSLAIKTAAHSDYILGRTPMLGIGELVLLLFGAYALSRRLIRAVYFLATVLLPVLVLAAINHSVAPLYFALPIFMLLAAIGVRFLYIEWRRVFPLNPLPRALALGLIAATLLIHAAYGLRYSLVAWPHNPDIKLSYVLK